MQTVLYNGSFEGWLSAVFDVYEYKLSDVHICTEQNFKGNIFDKVHTSFVNEENSVRVWNGLEKKLSPAAQKKLYRAFLSELDGIETSMLQYAQYVFSSKASIETDYSHPAVLNIDQTAKKVYREKHRMEAFVRFQKTADGIYFAPVTPDFNVLPLISPHFETRYADQSWIIYDTKRSYGIHYDLASVNQITINFNQGTTIGLDMGNAVAENEEMYQKLWQQYFKSVNISARKNTKLHIQHMPRRYWKLLTEKS